MRLLIVDDEVRITELLRVALTRSGFVVDAVSLARMREPLLPIFRMMRLFLIWGFPTAMALPCSGNCAPAAFKSPFSF